MSTSADDHYVVARSQSRRGAKHPRFRVSGIQSKAKQPEGHEKLTNEVASEPDVDDAG